MRNLFPEFPRNPSDSDYLVESKNDEGAGVLGDKWSEYHFIEPFAYKFNENDLELTADELYTLKMSHLFWDINWDKHMFDCVYLRGKGAKLIRPLFDELYGWWCAEKGTPKRSDLDMEKDRFFTNAITCPHDHDYMHTLINPIPTYTKILVDPDGVNVSEEKYDTLTFDEKCDLVREEVYVMAYERLAGRDYRTAYRWMLKQMVLVHAPMYEAMFILENYYALRNPIINYKTLLDGKLNK